MENEKNVYKINYDDLIPTFNHCLHAICIRTMLTVYIALPLTTNIGMKNKKNTMKLIPFEMAIAYTTKSQNVKNNSKFYTFTFLETNFNLQKRKKILISLLTERVSEREPNVA